MLNVINYSTYITVEKKVLRCRISKGIFTKSLGTQLNMQ